MASCNLCLPGLKGCHNCCKDGPHFYVDQREYFPVPRGRMETFEPMEITFRKGGICGIPVRDGVSKHFSGLERRDSRPFEGVDVAEQCTLRIEWPGYPPWNKSFRTRDSSSVRTPVSLSRLATEICRAIEKFIQEMDGGMCEEECWRVGAGTSLNVDNLALISLKRASYGSWTACVSLVSLT